MYSGQFNVRQFFYSFSKNIKKKKKTVICIYFELAVEGDRRACKWQYILNTKAMFKYERLDFLLEFIVDDLHVQIDIRDLPISDGRL